jgi:C-terminal processing protease CtpA/Prc
MTMKGSTGKWFRPRGLAAVTALLATIFAGAAPAAPTALDEILSAAAIREDFSDLYRRLQAAHFDLYVRASRSSYDRLYRTSAAAISKPESRFEAARRFQLFVAFGRVAHARIDTGYQAWRAHLDGGGRAFPLNLRIVNGLPFVVANASGLDSIAVGDRVIALDGQPIGEWLARARRHLSADTAYMADALLELDLPMLLWLEAGPRDAFTLRLRRANGSEATVTVPARTRAQMRAAAGAQRPRLDLSAADRSHRMIGDVAYLRPGPFYEAAPDAANPYDNSRFRRFIDEAFDGFLAGGARRLIVDLRDNPGGDSSFSDLMVSWFATRPYRFNSAFRIRVSAEAVAANQARLASSTGAAAEISRRFAALYARTPLGGIAEFDTPPARPREGRRFAGRVYVLVNRNSFSNAVAVAATIQDYGFGIILGEETSDLASTLGAMESFTLPRTGVVVGFPKARIVRPNGDRRPRGVVPDVAIETPLWEGPDDPVLRRALVLIRGGAGQSDRQSRPRG